MKFTILLALFFVASASADTEYELKTFLLAKQQKPAFFQWIPFPNRGVFGKLELTATSNGTDLGVIGGSELVELLNGHKTYKVTLPDDLSSVDSIGLKWSNSEKNKLSILFVTNLKVTGPADESEKFRSEHTALRPEVVYDFDRVIKPTEPATTEPVTTEASTTEASTTEPATTEVSTTEASTTEATEAASTDAATESEATSEPEAVSTETVAEETSSSETAEVSSEGQTNVEEETSTEGQSDSSSETTEAQAETAAPANEDGQGVDNVSDAAISGAAQETTDAAAQEAQPEPTSSESA